MVNVPQRRVGLNALRGWWLATGTLLGYLSLSFFCLSQQWPVKLPNAIVEKGDTTPQGAALYALVACLPLFGAELAIGWRYRLISNARYWRRRIPTPPLFEEGDDRSSEQAWAQVALVLFFHIIPGLLLAYFLIRLLTGTAVVGQVHISRWWQHLWPPVGWTAALGKYDPSADGKIAPDYLRFWEPWIFCLSVTVSVALLAWHLRELFHRDP